MLAIAHVKSKFNPDAAAGTTSASGLGQFINTTGASYGLTDANRWDVQAQATALVRHFIDNKNLAKRRHKKEEYIYKYHHDGPSGEHGGLAVSRRKVLPRIDQYEKWLQCVADMASQKPDLSQFSDNINLKTGIASCHRESDCKQKFDNYIRTENLTQPRSGSSTYGKWGTLTRADVSEVQTSEAVQDQFNFGSGDYVVDPRIWEMEESVDIGEQINSSINNPAGGMSEWYQRAASNPCISLSFTWPDPGWNDGIRRHAFNSDASEAIKTKAWPFGRVSAIIAEGNIIVCEDDSYFVKGKLVYQSDTYSWIADGDSFFHNSGIRILGNNWNAPDSGNWEHGTITSQIYLEDSSIQGYSFPRSIAYSLDSDKKYVQWHEPSSSYPDGEMPVHYAREYYFCTYGKKI